MAFKARRVIALTVGTYSAYSYKDFSKPNASVYYANTKLNRELDRGGLFKEIRSLDPPFLTRNPHLSMIFGCFLPAGNTYIAKT